MLFLILCPVAASLVDGPGVGRVGDFRKRVDVSQGIPIAGLWGGSLVPPFSQQILSQTRVRCRYPKTGPGLGDQTPKWVNMRNIDIEWG